MGWGERGAGVGGRIIQDVFGLGPVCWRGNRPLAGGMFAGATYLWGREVRAYVWSRHEGIFSAPPPQAPSLSWPHERGLSPCVGGHGYLKLCSKWIQSFGSAHPLLVLEPLSIFCLSRDPERGIIQPLHSKLPISSLGVPVIMDRYMDSELWCSQHLWEVEEVVCG